MSVPRLTGDDGCSTRCEQLSAASLPTRLLILGHPQLVKLGLVRYIGMSSCRTAEFMAMQYYAKSKGVSCPSQESSAPKLTLIAQQQTTFISMQPLHNAIYREEERDMFLACKVSPSFAEASQALELSSSICRDAIMHMATP